MPIPAHINWLKKIENNLKTADKKNVKLIEFLYPSDLALISNFACYLRNHYCKDEELDDLIKPFGFSRKEYLKKVKIPDLGHIKAADFSEIIVADYIQFILNYYIPRVKYEGKWNKNSSTMGIDILGFKIIDSDKNDEIITCEVKAALKSKNPDTLKNAIKKSVQDLDYIRKAQSLNAIKQRLKDKKETNNVKIIERFQDKTDRPYKEITGAAAVHSSETWDNIIITDSSCVDHPNIDNILLLVIRGKNLMDFVNNLYEIICNEA